MNMNTRSVSDRVVTQIEFMRFRARALFRYIRTRNAVGEPTQLGAGKRTDVDRYSSWKEEKKLVLSLSNSAAADVHFIIIIPTRILV